MATRKVGTTGRWGPRYGTKTKKIIAVIEKEQRKKQICPYCERPKLKRLAAGIWTCKKCGVKFAGGAYFPSTAIGKTVKKQLTNKEVTKIPEITKHPELQEEDAKSR